MCAVWGSTWIVIQGGLASLPPFTSAGVRFVIAAVVVTALTPVLRAREGGVAPRWWVWLTIGLLNFAFSYGVVYWSETRLPSALVAVLWALFPMMMAVCGHAFLPEGRLRPRAWAGFGLGFVGVVLLFATDLREIGAEGVEAALVLCASPAVSAVGLTVLKRHGSQASSVLVNRNAMWVGGIVLCGIAFAFEEPSRARWNAAAIGSVLYLALFGTVLTFSLYFWLLRSVAAHKLSLISYVVPAVALLLGRTVGEEPITAFTLGGTAAILLGVAFVARERIVAVE
jgi:drug/metabolite transporter (DMT)-like permease